MRRIYGNDTTIPKCDICANKVVWRLDYFIQKGKMNNIIKGDFHNFPPPTGTTLILADPLYDKTTDYQDILAYDLPTILFGYTNIIKHLPKPDDIAYWIKPVSTKNTVKHYSNFVEIILFYRTQLNTDLHWSNRTGIFTDNLINNKEHPFKKPESLIEKLLLNHYQGGVVYDPCAGSGTVLTVCKKLGIDCYSVEIK